jgi:tetratricopeptide (TPR) repeat protein
LGLALAKLGKYEEALVVFTEHGDEAQAYNNLGCVYLQKGEKKKAIRSFEKALEIKPAFYHRASQNLKKAKAARVYDTFSIKSDN